MAQTAIATVVASFALATVHAFTYSVKFSTNMVTVMRGRTSEAEKVNFRFVSLTAVDGIHFASPTNHVLSFAAGESTADIPMIELPVAAVEQIADRYQTGTSREYGFELYDDEGYVLADATRRINFGSDYSVGGSFVNQSVSNLVYFSCLRNGEATSFSTDMESGMYFDVAYVPSTNWITVTDAGYNQGVHTVSTDGFYSRAGAREYWSGVSNVILNATVCFQARDVDDGWHFIQILADNDSSWDDDDTDATIQHDPSDSLYKACHQLREGFPSNILEEGCSFYFPHRYDYPRRLQEAADGIPNGYSEFACMTNCMDVQKFRGADLRAPQAGALALSPAVNNLNIRFDASGEGHNDWEFKNLFVRMTLCDAQAPMLRQAVMAEGTRVKYGKVVITLVFDEIVNASGTVLHTSWGDLAVQEDASNRANAVPYVGYITADAGTELRITGFTGVPTDLAGNSFVSTGDTVVAVWDTLANNVVSAYQLPPVQDGVVQIASGLDLYKYSEMVAQQPKTSARLTCDIDMALSGDIPLPAMGTLPGFAGTFDGNGQVIRNLQNVESVEGHAGLFAVVAPRGVVKNVGLVDANITRPAEWTFGGICGLNYGTVEGCWFTGAYCAGSTLNTTNYGGIVGMNTARGTVRNCVSVNTAGNALNDAVGTNNGVVENVDFLELGEFASGHVCYILNGCVTNGTQVWYQRIGSDAFPTNSGPTVYYHNGHYVNSLGGSLGSPLSAAPAFLAGAAPSVRANYESWANRYGAAAAGGANEATFLLNADPASQVPDSAALLKVVDFRRTATGFHLELASDVAPLTQNEAQSGTSAVCNGYLTVYAATSPSAPRDAWTALSVPAVDAGNGRIAVDIAPSDFPAGQSADGSPVPMFFIAAITVTESPSPREK